MDKIDEAISKEHQQARLQLMVVTNILREISEEEDRGDEVDPIILAIRSIALCLTSFGKISELLEKKMDGEVRP